jgi:putative oxidoreductase
VEAVFDPSPHFVFPELRTVYAALAPIAEAALRIAVGACLVPHGLRMGFGFFPNSAGPVRGWRQLGDALEKWGYWPPGRLWAIVILLTELVGGPLFALGLFTRPVAVPIVILLAMSVYDHIRDGWFWNTRGVEYPLIWSLAAAYFLIHGGGMYSIDHLLGWEF